jgi:iron complex transport system ATP-binding protein
MHDLDAAARVATRVVLLKAGRVVAAGPPDEVMVPATLRATFDAQLDVVVHEPSGQRVFVASPASERLTD